MPAKIKETSSPLAEISQGPNRFEEFMERNQKGVLVLAIVLVIAAAGLVIYRGIRTSARETAGAELVKADDMAALSAITDNEAGTPAGGSALILLSEKQWTDGQRDPAIASLRKFISEYPDHSALPTARAGLGTKLMAQGKSGDAAKEFQNLLEDPASRYLAPFALISLGDAARTEGDSAKAKTFYERARTEYPQSNFVETATRRLSTLDAKAPVEIEAPPAPPAPTPGTGLPLPPGTLPPSLPDAAPIAPAPHDDGTDVPEQELTLPSGNVAPPGLEITAPEPEPAPESKPEPQPAPEPKPEPQPAPEPQPGQP